MRKRCPNKKCKETRFIIKNGRYYRKSDYHFVQRYKCVLCKKQFSSATFSPCYYQKKRKLNGMIFKLLSSGISMRRVAFLLETTYITVQRKLYFLAKSFREKHDFSLKKIKTKEIQIDDLITFEHTKLKPLSITIIIDKSSRKILKTKVSTIPAFGLLAKKSRKKYGKRKNEHKGCFFKLMQELRLYCIPQVLIETDEHKDYKKVISQFFPWGRHKAYKGKRGAVVGQGELKKVIYDPLFMVNHTCAMLRANINRLARRTWCTTKKIESLQCHLDLYTFYHNNKLIL